MDGFARTQHEYSSPAEGASLENNYTWVTNFLFEDPLHLFAAKGTNKDTGSWHRATVQLY